MLLSLAKADPPLLELAPPDAEPVEVVGAGLATGEGELYVTPLSVAATSKTEPPPNS